MKAVLIAVLALAGCIGASHASMTVNGTTFEYQDSQLEVVAVGSLDRWEEVRFSAQPALQATGDADAVIGSEPATIASGPLQVGQHVILCGQDAGVVEFTLVHARSRSRVTLQVAEC